MHYPSSGSRILISFQNIIEKKRNAQKENKKPLLSMVRLGPIRECSRMICNANGETPPNSSIIWRHHAAWAKKAKVLGRCMGRNRNCAWRYRASQCCIFHQPLQSICFQRLLVHRCHRSFELDTLIPRIRSKWGLSKAGVCCALVCFAYHKEGLGERRYRRTLVLVNDGAFTICAVEASEKLRALCIATVAQLILSILPRA